MATKKPVVISSGTIQQVQSSDNIDASTLNIGLGLKTDASDPTKLVTDPSAQMSIVTLRF